MAYNHGTVSVTSTVSSINVYAQNDGVLINNQGSVIVYVGGPNVTADTTATGGFPIAANSTVKIPTAGDSARSLYLVTAADAALVSFIQPQRNS